MQYSGPIQGGREVTEPRGLLVEYLRSKPFGLQLIKGG